MAEIGRTASKQLSTECSKATSLSNSDVGFDSSRVIVGTEQREQLQQLHYQEQRQLSPPSLQQQQQQQLQQQDRTDRTDRTSFATVWQSRKALGETATTPPPPPSPPSYRNRVPFATAQLTTENNQQQQQQQPQPLINANNVTSTAKAVPRVRSAFKTTINIGFAMNHVNDQENLKQLSLAPIQVNEVEEMDTQEGECTHLHLSQFI